MSQPDRLTTKDNVNRFNDDVSTTGSYAYTGEHLSAQLANERISRAIETAYDFTHKRILDLGCGDGTYTLEFAARGATSVLGVDPAKIAIDAATARAKNLELTDRVHFALGNIYELDALVNEGGFDCIVLRGVLHHLPDPARAIARLSSFKGTVIILEANGLNPILKMLEKFSRYHIEHEERSFTPMQIRRWLQAAGLPVHGCGLINLVPFFCPNWMARLLRRLEPLIERLPIIRAITCGQYLITAGR